MPKKTSGWSQTYLTRTKIFWSKCLIDLWNLSLLLHCVNCWLAFICTSSLWYWRFVRKTFKSLFSSWRIISKCSNTFRCIFFWDSIQKIWKKSISMTFILWGSTLNKIFFLVLEENSLLFHDNVWDVLLRYELKENCPFEIYFRMFGKVCLHQYGDWRNKIYIGGGFIAVSIILNGWIGKVSLRLFELNAFKRICKMKQNFGCSSKMEILFVRNCFVQNVHLEDISFGFFRTLKLKRNSSFGEG